jgi:hypothetical protein
MKSEIQTQQLKTSLLQSIHQYENMLDYMQNLDKGVGTAAPSALMRLNDRLVELQKNMTQTEEIVSFRLQEYSGNMEAVQSLVEMRQHLLRDILFLNQRITVKATGIRSYITSEMGKLHTGLSAMKGYKQQQNNLGRIINSKS